MKSEDELRAAIVTETIELRAFGASFQSAQTVALLDALIDSHVADLVTIKPDQLAFKQGAIAQLQRLRAVLVDDNPHLLAKA